jgi:hypothetical protein
MSFDVRALFRLKRWAIRIHPSRVEQYQVLVAFSEEACALAVMDSIQKCAALVIETPCTHDNIEVSKKNLGKRTR